MRNIAAVFHNEVVQNILRSIRRVEKKSITEKGNEEKRAAKRRKGKN